MAKMTVIACDNCGEQIEGLPYLIKVTRKDASNVIHGELCSECVNVMFGGASWSTRKKPGRKPNGNSDES